MNFLGKPKISNYNVNITNEIGFFLELLQLHATFKNSVHLDGFKVHQNVGKFQVSMNDVHIVDCFETFDYLTQKVSGLLLSKFTSQFTKLIKITTVAVLCEEIEVVDCLLNIKQPDDVRMLDL